MMGNSWLRWMLSRLPFGGTIKLGRLRSALWILIVLDIVVAYFKLLMITFLGFVILLYVETSFDVPALLTLGIGLNLFKLLLYWWAVAVTRINSNMKPERSLYAAKSYLNAPIICIIAEACYYFLFFPNGVWIPVCVYACFMCGGFIIGVIHIKNEEGKPGFFRTLPM